MTFTGTLIEDLMATVERAEHRAQANEPLFAMRIFAEHVVADYAADHAIVGPWFASVQENAEYDSKVFGVS
jgi:hypothetical protein